MTARRKLPSFVRSFGVVSQPLPSMSYNYDIGKTNPNQNVDGYFMGCRGYTLADIAGDEDDAIYQHQNTYDRICAWEGHGISTGGQIVDALDFGMAEGLLRIDESTETQALQHRRGKWFYVDKVQGRDWFDSHRIAMRLTKVPISVGTIFFDEWVFTPIGGLMTANFAFDGTWDTESGHNYKMCGETVINGKDALIIKPWIGRIMYIGREAFNRAFDVYGTASFIQPQYQPKDVYYVKLTLLQHIIYLLRKYISETLASRFASNYQ